MGPTRASFILEMLGSLLGVRVEEIPQGELFAQARALEPEAVAPARARPRPS